MPRQKTEVAERWAEIEKYATIKHLKKQLTRKAKRQRLSDATWGTYRYWLGKFIPFTQKNPDQLIEDALKDNEETENLLIDFKNFCIDQGLDDLVKENRKLKEELDTKESKE